MLWEDFLEFNQLDLFEMWNNWIPPHNKNTNGEKFYYVNNPYYESWYDAFEDELCENGEEFIELIDDGSRVTSFEDFVCCAYENSIP